MGFRKLLEIGDRTLREQLEDYYVLSKERYENLMYNLETGLEARKALVDEQYLMSKRIIELENIVQELRYELACKAAQEIRGDNGWLAEKNQPK